MAPEQWHLMQPNWPSDHRTLAARAGRPAVGTARHEGHDRLAVLAVGARRRPGPGARSRPRAARPRRRRPRHRPVRRPAARARRHDRRPERPVRRNGSISPIASGTERCRRGRSRRCACFAPDVVHLHEPLVPGPTLTRSGADAPIVGTFHANYAGNNNRWYPMFRPPLNRLVNRLDGPHRGLAGGGRARVEVVRRGSTRSCPNGVDVDAISRPSRGRRPGPPILFLGRHEPRKGLAVLLDAFAGLDRDAVLWVASDGPETGVAAGPRRPERRVARADHRAREGAPAAGRHDLLRSRARRRVVRHRAARGDGGAAPRCSRPTSPGTANVARADREALLVPPRRRRGAPRRAAPPARRPRLRGPSWSRRARSGRGVLAAPPRRAVHPGLRARGGEPPGHRAVTSRR